jgi:predicted CXXCH cytochrome family protein
LGVIGFVVASVVLSVTALLPAGEQGQTVLAMRGLTPSAGPGWGGAVSCQSCHRADALFSHPIGVAPVGVNAPGLPLQAGRMTCLTCHTEAAPDHGMSRGLADGSNAMLRAASAEALCGQCHMGSQRGSGHTRGVARAHLSWPNNKRGGGRSRFELDVETQNCLSCHDGTVAQDVAVRAGDRPEGSHVSSHPVGVPQAPRLGRNSIAPMVPATAVNHRVRLFDGNVGCGSCHSLYSKEAKLLVMSNFRSALCLSCHRE